jgi:hypothetical protein
VDLIEGIKDSFPVGFEVGHKDLGILVGKVDGAVVEEIELTRKVGVPEIIGAKLGLFDGVVEDGSSVTEKVGLIEGKLLGVRDGVPDGVLLGSLDIAVVGELEEGFALRR